MGRVPQRTYDSTFAAARLNIEFYRLHAFLECVHRLLPVLIKIQDFVRIPVAHFYISVCRYALYHRKNTTVAGLTLPAQLANQSIDFTFQLAEGAHISNVTLYRTAA